MLEYRHKSVILTIERNIFRLRTRKISKGILMVTSNIYIQCHQDGFLCKLETFTISIIVVVRGDYYQCMQ
jgi:hypothetical protein